MKPTALTDQPTGTDAARYAEAEAWRQRVEAGLEDEPICEICDAIVNAENWPDGPAPFCRACELEVDARITADGLLQCEVELPGRLVEMGAGK